MNPVELKLARIRRRRSVRSMSRLVGVSDSAWNSRERGETKVSIQESAIISNDLELTEKEFIDIFYDGKLPFRKDES